MAIHSRHSISFLPIMSYLVILIFAGVALSCLSDPDPEQNRNVTTQHNRTRMTLIGRVETDF